MYSVKSATVKAVLGAFFIVSAVQVSATPVYSVEPAPACDPLSPTIDLDFRISDFSDGMWKNVQVTASGGLLKWRGCNDADNPGDGFGVDSGRPLNDDVEKGEVVVVEVLSTGANQTAAFDVTGVYFSGFVDSNGPGETCEVTLTDIAGATTTYTISRDHPATDSGKPNPNDEFLFGFVDSQEDPLRITKAEVTAIRGDCGVIGFTNSPVTFAPGDCGPGDPNPQCNSKLAADVELEAEFNNDVSGILYKEGVIVAEETRPFCLDGSVPNTELPLDLNGDGEVDLKIPPEYCGYPGPAIADGTPYINILTLRSTLKIDGDVIDLLFDDTDLACIDADLQPELFDPLNRPVALRWPNNMESANGATAAPFLEIPYVVAGAAEGTAEIDASLAPRNITANPCSSFRGNGFSIFAYHLKFAGAPAGENPDEYTEALYRGLFEESLAQLGFYKTAVYPCIDRNGTAQSTFQYYLNHISDNYYRDKFAVMEGYIEEFIDRLEDPTSHLYEDIIGCDFDLSFSGYPFAVDGSGAEGTPFVEPSDGNNLVPANAIGYLRAQLEHLLWLADGLPQ